MTKVPSLDRGAPADTPSYVKNSSFLSRDIEAQKAKKDPVPKEVKSPPISTFKVQRSDSKAEERPSPPTPKTNTKDNHDKTKSAVETVPSVDNGNVENTERTTEKPDENNTANNNKVETGEESVGVGDKIKKFEKAAEDASGKQSRPGSVRGRNRTERLGSDGKDDLPLPPPPDLEPNKTHTKNNVPPPLVRQSSLIKAAPPIVTKAAPSVKWAPSLETDKKKVDSQRIIRPECKQPPSPADATIRSPALGTKLGDTFPSRGTAFRNVAADHRTPDEPKTCKKTKACVTKGSGYFTRGSEEIWLVKKKDIEEIEERVLDSFRRGDTVARGSVARRQGYARSESLDPQWAGRAHTLQRQSSVAVACTCGHDKKPRAKSAGADNARPRARSHADDAHVLDKYETLV